jgi:hypothetical protein
MNTLALDVLQTLRVSPPPVPFCNSSTAFLSWSQPISTFHLDITFFFPVTNMSEASVHLSNESPSSTVPLLPGSNLQSTFPSVSPALALSIFQIIEAQGISNLTRAVTYGLTSTIHGHDIAHHLETKNLKRDNTTLQ